jgi:hypothetical protein
MARCCQLGVHELAIHTDFEAPAVRGNQSDRLDTLLELLEQISRQANGPVGIVSDRAVGDLDF